MPQEEEEDKVLVTNNCCRVVLRRKRNKGTRQNPIKLMITMRTRPILFHSSSSFYSDKVFLSIPDNRSSSWFFLLVFIEGACRERNNERRAITSEKEEEMGYTCVCLEISFSFFSFPFLLIFRCVFFPILFYLHIFFLLV